MSLRNRTRALRGELDTAVADVDTPTGEELQRILKHRTARKRAVAGVAVLAIAFGTAAALQNSTSKQAVKVADRGRGFVGTTLVKSPKTTTPTSKKTTPSSAPKTTTTVAPTTTTTRPPLTPAGRPNTIVAIRDGAIVALDGAGNELGVLVPAPASRSDYPSNIFLLPDNRVAYVGTDPTATGPGHEAAVGLRIIGTNTLHSIGIGAAIAPDGHTLAQWRVSLNYGIDVSDINSTSARPLWNVGDYDTSTGFCWGFSQDGSQLYVLWVTKHQEKRLDTVEVSSGRVLRRVTAHQATDASGCHPQYPLVTLADGRVVNTIRDDVQNKDGSYSTSSRIVAIDPVSGAVTKLATLNYDIGSVSLDRAGTHLLIASAHGLQTLDLDGTITTLAPGNFLSASW